MTTIPPTASAAQTTAPNSTATARKPTQSFNSDMFLQLLVTQLRNQDPTSPMDSTQMVSQTSALASMEQLTALTKTSTDGYSMQMRTAAANILGKQVSWTDSAGAPQHGLATAVSFSGDTPIISVGSASVKLTDLSGIAATT